MLKFLFALLTLLFLACTNNQGDDYDTGYASTFDSILNESAMQGVIVVYDPQSKTYFSNDFERAKTGYIPASTFKIPHSIIALETNVITDPETILPWDGEKRDMHIWERDMSFQEAFRTSCVPCFQQIAREIGEERMKGFLNKLRYGKMQVQQDVDEFWLHGSSRITPMEQIDFLDRLHHKKLPILTTTREKILNMMEIEQGPNYRFGGKTGLSNEDGVINGWFVGYLVKGEKNYYFALQASPLETANLDAFIPNREQAIRSALARMGLTYN